MCSVVWTIWLDRLERQVLAEQHVTAALMAAGAEGLVLPDLTEREEYLRTWLLSPIGKADPAEQMDPELRELRQALGYSGA